MSVVDGGQGSVPSLARLCVQRLAQNLIKYGPKKVRLGSLSGLPRYALEALLEVLVAKNALNDNVLPHVLTRQTRKLFLEGSSQLRRCLLNTIGRSCPNLRVLDVRACQQVDNRIVRDVLAHCEHLTTLRVDGCTRISDSAFAPALWKPPLGGLLGLEELSIGKCGQVTGEGLLGFVMKGAPSLKTLGLAFCRLMITDENAAELLFNFNLECLDFSFCSQITDAPFQVRPSSMLRELRVTHTQISDQAVESLAQRAPLLTLFDAGWVVRLTDRSVAALVEHCPLLKSLCVCNTQITDAAFEALVRCRHLETLDASWCLRATVRALDILARIPDGAEGSRNLPPLRDLNLNHLGAFSFDAGGDVAGMPGMVLQPPAPAELWKCQSNGTMSACASPIFPLCFLSSRPPDVPSLQLPPSAQALSPTLRAAAAEDPPELEDQLPAVALSPPASLRRLVVAYASSLEQLFLEGVRDLADASALEAIAANCPSLQRLALTFSAPARDGTSREAEAALEAGLRKVGANCSRLVALRLDAALRPHKALIAPLSPPSFARLRSLTLCCASKGGLLDEELEAILHGRVGLETVELRNCEGLSEGLFPKWCHREKHDEAQVVQQLDQALLSSLSNLNFGVPGPDLLEPVPSPQEPLTEMPPAPRIRRRQHPKCPAALALRSVTSFSLGGAVALSDRSADALAELLRDAQTVDARGCPLLTEESLRSFRKGCRHLRSVSIVTRERTLSWTASTSAVKRHHHRKSGLHTSGSSGTESN